MEEAKKQQEEIEKQNAAENTSDEQTANTDKELQEEKTENTAEETEDNSSKNEEQAVKELSEEEKYQQLNDKYLRLYSDFDNFRKRTMKEKADLVLNAGQGVIKDLLPVLDDFERAIESNSKSEDLEGLKQGFELIYNKFQAILKQKGLKEMTCKGETFDADVHEAITNIPAPTEDDKGKIIDVIEKGYYLNEKVIRYAKVVVGQ
jgi:molecular chaperone GrpE